MLKKVLRVIIRALIAADVCFILCLASIDVEQEFSLVGWLLMVAGASGFIPFAVLVDNALEV